MPLRFVERKMHTTPGSKGPCEARDVLNRQRLPAGIFRRRCQPMSLQAKLRVCTCVRLVYDPGRSKQQYVLCRPISRKRLPRSQQNATCNRKHGVMHRACRRPRSHIQRHASQDVCKFSRYLLGRQRLHPGTYSRRLLSCVARLAATTPSFSAEGNMQRGPPHDATCMQTTATHTQ